MVPGFLQIHLTFYKRTFPVINNLLWDLWQVLGEPHKSLYIGYKSDSEY